MNQTPAPRFAAVLSSQADTLAAAQQACQQAIEQLGAAPHLAFVFASFHHQPRIAELAATLKSRLGDASLLGCTGESIVCNQQEIEGQPALALWLAYLPGVDVRPMRLEFQPTREGGSFSGWPDDLDTSAAAPSTLLLLGEPFSFPADVLLHRLNDDTPGLTVLGAMASGGWQPQQNRLLLDDREIVSGAVAVWLSGPLSVSAVVSQGCRPVGRPMIVTKAERNVILELGGQPALEQLQALYADSPAADQALMQQGLHVGLVINEYQERFDRGDFLIRNVQGVDSQQGAVAIGDYVRVGQTVQFHVRDAATADEDLAALLNTARAASAPAAGALVFTCNGRGTRLFDAPHHDAQSLARHFPGIPAAGLFAQGEIGPIGGKCFVHGFTASIALFGPPPA